MARGGTLVVVSRRQASISSVRRDFPRPLPPGIFGTQRVSVMRTRKGVAKSKSCKHRRVHVQHARMVLKTLHNDPDDLSVLDVFANTKNPIESFPFRVRDPDQRHPIVQSIEVVDTRSRPVAIDVFVPIGYLDRKGTISKEFISRLVSGSGCRSRGKECQDAERADQCIHFGSVSRTLCRGVIGDGDQ